MTKEEALEKLIDCQNDNDTETAHYYADKVLCDFMKSLGYGDVVSEYEKIGKWFS